MKSDSAKQSKATVRLAILAPVAIVAVLALLLVPGYTRARAQAATQADLRNLKVAAVALDAYAFKNGHLPIERDFDTDATGAKILGQATPLLNAQGQPFHVSIDGERYVVYDPASLVASTLPTDIPVLKSRDGDGRHLAYVRAQGYARI